ncbi:hypothetical protein EJ110_NYTH03488 [Nymphaea thermarum]|nr:hypothetical protein EJ110_NYTH03488 [Nymphaea thermarum]
MVSRVQQQQAQQQAFRHHQQQQQQNHQQQKAAAGMLSAQFVKIKGSKFKRSSVNGEDDAATSAILLIACAVFTP